MSPTQAAQAAEAHTRPRIEGEREDEILDACVDLLAEVGYDRLTMDAVAARAKARKATLYRRWASKAELVIEASFRAKRRTSDPDTGSLRGDLLALLRTWGHDRRRVDDPRHRHHCDARDAEFAEVFRRDFIAPKIARHATSSTARDRGEIAPT